MDNFIQIDKHFTPDSNFWELNPQLAVIAPFSELYKRDNSKDKMVSSKEAWSVFFMSESSSYSKMYRLSDEEKKEEIKENIIDVDWDDTIIQECIDRYPVLCMSAIEKALKNEEDFLIRRAKFIRIQEYVLTRTEVVEGRAIRVEGNVKELEAMAKATKSIWDNYQKVKDEFIKEQNKQSIKGGRKESKSEKGEI